MRDILQVLRALILALWPLTVAAAGESLGATLGAVTLADWLSLAVLSGVSGLVALLHRVRRSFEAAATTTPEGSGADDVQRIDWRLFAAAHMAGAMFMGAIMFFVAEAGDWNSFLEAAAIALASWSGAKLADRWADAFGDRVSSVIGAKGGQQP